MQEFPESKALQFLIGLEVTNVILQSFSIDVNFDDGSFLVCEHLLDHKNKRGEVDALDVQRGLDRTSLYGIVGRRIVGIERRSFDLVLDFDDGQALKIISKPGPRESGRISHNGSVIVF